MNRRDSSRIAAIRAAEAGELAGLKESPAIGSVVASDAFFPFADGLLAAAEAGATAVIQPGGSMRDKEVIEAADGKGLAVGFTTLPHFPPSRPDPDPTTLYTSLIHTAPVRLSPTT